jgi:hypothetical protein
MGKIAVWKILAGARLIKLPGRLRWRAQNVIFCSLGAKYATRKICTVHPKSPVAIEGVM